MFSIRSNALVSDALAVILGPGPRPQLFFRAARRQSNLRIKHSLRATTLPTPPPLSVLATSKDVAAARDWLKGFGGCSIPRAAVDITFSRSSGPGGQNVNKVNTKSTLRCALDSSWIPLWAHDGLLASPYFVRSTRSILLTSTLHRSQAQNVDDCLSKLHALISSASSRPFQDEPSEVQRERVRTLERRANVQRRLQKDKRSQTKRQRGTTRLDWD
ncbi:hypothetical protein EDB92DRAFT_1803521 [Lactarius akahatsu]|uniref:Prokaryotic-type class I peptide chain release factors domain-containing protein n=1 Tax=Lactarius akahatsu TaxID=416441 RepID=A0AAD4L7Y8_9AGAM|nr:hypothetical protein EDB92DRAFT_1803521 [Lactarius akahatsu]